MENGHKITALLASFCLILCTLPISCRLPATTTLLDEGIHIVIEPCLKIDLMSNEKEPAPLVTFEKLSLETGTLDSEHLHPTLGLLPQGEPCFLLTGMIENGYDEGTWVAYNGTGYDDSGRAVSYTLDTGAIVGVARTYIDGKSTDNFTLHLSWSDNVSIIKISSFRSDIMPP